jgi:hypothetical protein
MPQILNAPNLAEPADPEPADRRDDGETTMHTWYQCSGGRRGRILTQNSRLTPTAPSGVQAMMSASPVIRPSRKDDAMRDSIGGGRATAWRERS